MIMGWVFLNLLFLALPLAALGFFGWLALRFVRARERDVARLDGVRTDELARLEDAVLVLESEISALRERQDFVERLLERPRPGPGG
jgi:cell division protein FtsB